MGTTRCVATNRRFGRTYCVHICGGVCNINMDTVSSFEILGTNARLHEVTCERNRPLYSQQQRERQMSHEMRSVTGRILAVVSFSVKCMRLLPRIIMLEYRNSNFGCFVGPYSLVRHSKRRADT